METKEDGAPLFSIVASNNGTASYYIFQGDTFITEVKPDAWFGYWIEPGKDLRVSVTPPSDLEIKASAVLGHKGATDLAAKLNLTLPSLPVKKS